jgi:hypothetical protein
MGVVAEKLIAQFETLPADEKQAVAREILRRLPSYDSGPLDDDVAAHAGDQMAALLDEEENDPQAR